MRLYIDPLAPNARRVQMFMVEQRLSVTLERINLMVGEQLEPEFLAKNPLGQLPVLELEDGTCLSESVAICRYLEETGHVRNSMFGNNPLERARIEMWQRRAEQGILIPAVEYGHHTAAMFRALLEQVPAHASVCARRLESFWPILDGTLAQNSHLAGQNLSIADVTAFCGVEVAALWGLAPPAHLVHVHTWRQRVGRRPSASVVRYPRVGPRVPHAKSTD